LTQEKLSERVGKKRATVANYLRLLKLPASVQMAIQNHQIDTGHARALLSLDDPKEQVKLFKEIQNKGYSVRQVEDIVKQMHEGDDTNEVKPKMQAQRQLPQEYEDLRGQFAQWLGMDVKLSCSPKGNGKLSFSFQNIDELRRILSLIQK
jgi:ParB family chromosome partitioning protein